MPVPCVTNRTIGPVGVSRTSTSSPSARPHSASSAAVWTSAAASPVGESKPQSAVRRASHSGDTSDLDDADGIRIGDGYDIAIAQRTTAALIDNIVDLHNAFREQRLGVATGIDETSKFEQLAEIDPAAAYLDIAHGTSATRS